MKIHIDCLKLVEMKINYKLVHGVSSSKLCLDPRDILETFKYLLLLKSGRGEVDDIDHLGNRRVRTVGELIEDRFFVGVERLSKTIKEKMNYNDVAEMMPSDIVIPKSVTSVVKEFFATGQLLNLWIKQILCQKLLTKDDLVH